MICREESKSAWCGVNSRWFGRLRFLVLIAVAGAFGQRSVAAAGRGPYLQNLQSDRVTVCWELGEPQGGEVRLFDGDNAAIGTFVSEATGVRHEVVVEGLQPGRRYSYEVLSQPGSKVLGKGSFQSVPPKGGPFSFVAWGDTRGNEKTSEALASQILRTGVGMCLHSGDFVDDGKRLDQWSRQFFSPLGPLLSDMVLWPAVGNHDTGVMPDEKTSVFTHLFALPGAETCFSFDYGDAHFIVFDSTKPLDEQVAFAEKDLARMDAKWLFAAWHHPPFSSGGHPSHAESRTKLLPLLARHNVDMIILGHNHHFMVSRPIRHIYEPKQKRAYVQLVTGGGGANPYEVEEGTRWFDQGVKAYHFVLIEVEGEKLRGKAIDTGGHVIRTFEIDRTRPLQDAVAFELIELERYLEELKIANTNLEGWPTGLVLKAGSDSGELVYHIRNPLRKPIRLGVRFDVSDGLRFEHPSREVEIAGGEEKEIKAPFRVTSAQSLYPLRGPSVSFESEFGRGQVRMEAPPIALGREVVAHRKDGAVKMDGEANESVWQGATEHGRFVIWKTGDLEYESPRDESTLRAVHDGDHLYLFLHRPGADFEDRDHFSVFLASPDKALGVRARVTGEHGFEGTRGIDEGVEVAHATSPDGIGWEFRVPLAKFREDMARPDQPLWLNVMEARGNTFFTLAPTFRQFPNRANSATLVLE